MNEKIKLRDNGKLLVKLSLTLNILILIAKIAIVVALIISRVLIIDGISKSAESGNAGGFFAGIFVFLIAFVIIGILGFAVKAIFSAVTIIVGFSRKFDKTYSTLSLVTVVFNCVHTFGLVASLPSNIMNAKSNPYETIIYAIVVVVMLAFAIINTTIQMMLSKYNSRRELEELQKGTNDDTTLFL